MKKVLSMALALILALSFTFSVRLEADAAFAMSYVGGHTVQNGVNYAKYNVTSKVNGNTLACTTLTFNPANGFIPMVFAKYSGTRATLNNHYSDAVGKYGYNVAGVINGSFFSMTTGSLNGMNIVNGKIASTYAGCSGEVVAFGSDGSMNVVSSNISYTVGINGKSYTDMFYAANRTEGKNNADWDPKFYYYDTSCGSKCDTYDICRGTEILCKKLDNTDLAVGQTLVGEVISVTPNTYGGSLGATSAYSDNFILFMKNDSSLIGRISGVKSGDRITISTQETVASSRAVMEKANSVIPNVGWLVRDGVDQTLIYSTIGTHSVTLQARWTAFGKKADGSYIFFTSEGGSTGSGGSLTLRDVAQAMINMGCRDVIRMDGGGSSAMYVSNTGSGSAGYVQSSTRPVADCILVTSRAGATKASVKSALQAKINEAEAAYASTQSSALRTKIDEARAVYDSATSVMGDHKREIMELREINSAEGILESALNAAAGVSAADYSDFALDRIEYAYKEARGLLASSAADAQLAAAAQKLQTFITDTSNRYNRLSLGAVYSTHAAQDSYPDKGLCELTDGALFGEDAYAAQWAGYHQSKCNGSVAGKGSYTDVKVDLGEAKAVNAFGLSALQLKSWGIGAPTSVEVYASDDGEEYYYHSTLTRTVAPTEDRYQVIPYECVFDTATTNRYYMFRMFYSASFIFIGEVSVYGVGEQTYAPFSAFNRSIQTDDTIIFDGGFNGGVLDGSHGNLTWSAGAICSYDADNGRYMVQQVVYPYGDTSYSYTVPTDGIIIGMHGTSNLFTNYVGVGYAAYLTGIDVKTKTSYPGARVTFLTPDSSTVSYTAPTLPVVKTDTGAKNEQNGYIRLPRQNMTQAEVKGLFLDPRTEATGIGATGTTVTVGATGTTYTLYLPGDIDCDASVSVTDYVQLKKDLRGQLHISGVPIKAADFDSNGRLSALDVVVLYSLLKG